MKKYTLLLLACISGQLTYATCLNKLEEALRDQETNSTLLDNDDSATLDLPQEKQLESKLRSRFEKPQYNIYLSRLTQILSSLQSACFNLERILAPFDAWLKDKSQENNVEYDKLDNAFNRVNQYAREYYRYKKEANLTYKEHAELEEIEQDFIQKSNIIFYHYLVSINQMRPDSHDSLANSINAKIKDKYCVMARVPITIH